MFDVYLNIWQFCMWHEFCNETWPTNLPYISWTKWLSITLSFMSEGHACVQLFKVLVSSWITRDFSPAISAVHVFWRGSIFRFLNHKLHLRPTDVYISLVLTLIFFIFYNCNLLLFLRQNKTKYSNICSFLSRTRRVKAKSATNKTT